MVTEYLLVVLQANFLRCFNCVKSFLKPLVGLYLGLFCAQAVSADFDIQSFKNVRFFLDCEMYSTRRVNDTTWFPVSDALLNLGSPNEICVDDGFESIDRGSVVSVRDVTGDHVERLKLMSQDGICMRTFLIQLEESAGNQLKRLTSIGSGRRMILVLGNVAIAAPVFYRPVADGNFLVDVPVSNNCDY